MIVTRALHEHEQYLRSNAGTVNLATQPSTSFQFGPGNAREIYVVPALSLTLAGPNLFTNLHRFGDGAGLLRLEQRVVDGLGAQFDVLSGRAIAVGTRGLDSGSVVWYGCS
jgi:hypothetical protein